MSVFFLWLLWRSNKLQEQTLEQIRRSQLTPAERALEDKAKAEAKAQARARTIALDKERTVVGLVGTVLFIIMLALIH